ncbi:MAG: signal peptidase I, partial [Solobacterium sp.]|nr:signal peptidase I [Solobacterium sp.]
MDQGTLTQFTMNQLETELSRQRYRYRFMEALKNTVYFLITVAAIAVLVAVLFLPVLQVYGTSMTPTLSEGNIVLSVKGSQFKTGDIIAFYYNNKILIKRVIASAGQWVDIGDDGTVYVDNVQLSESGFGGNGIHLGAGTLGALEAWSSIANMTLTDAATPVLCSTADT